MAYSIVHDMWASICTGCREHRDNPGDNDEDMFWQNERTAIRAVKMAGESADWVLRFLVASFVCVVIAHHDLFAWLPWPVVVAACAAGIANERIPICPWFTGNDQENIRHMWYMAMMFTGVLAVTRSALHAWHTPTYLVVVIPMLTYLFTRRTPELWLQDGTTFVIIKRDWW